MLYRFLPKKEKPIIVNTAAMIAPVIETLLIQMRATLIKQMMPPFISVAPMFANWK